MLTREEVRTACMQRPGVTAEFPFGPDAEVFKVLGKMFALIPTDEPHRISLKGDPGWNEALRTTYQAVTAGYHLNKRHWNTVTVDGEVPDAEVLEMIETSYDLVVAKLTRKQRESLDLLT